jgi:hypothetical protein
MRGPLEHADLGKEEKRKERPKKIKDKRKKKKKKAGSRTNKECCLTYVQKEITNNLNKNQVCPPSRTHSHNYDPWIA